MRYIATKNQCHTCIPNIIFVEYYSRVWNKQRGTLIHFCKFLKEKKLKNDYNALIDVKII